MDNGWKGKTIPFLAVTPFVSYMACSYIFSECPDRDRDDLDLEDDKRRAFATPFNPSKHKPHAVHINGYKKKILHQVQQKILNTKVNTQEQMLRTNPPSE